MRFLPTVCWPPDAACLPADVAHDEAPAAGGAERKAAQRHPRKRRADASDAPSAHLREEHVGDECGRSVGGGGWVRGESELFSDAYSTAQPTNMMSPAHQTLFILPIRSGPLVDSIRRQRISSLGGMQKCVDQTGYDLVLDQPDRSKSAICVSDHRQPHKRNLIIQTTPQAQSFAPCTRREPIRPSRRDANRDRGDAVR